MCLERYPPSSFGSYAKQPDIQIFPTNCLQAVPTPTNLSDISLEISASKASPTAQGSATPMNRLAGMQHPGYNTPSPALASVLGVTTDGSQQCSVSAHGHKGLSLACPYAKGNTVLHRKCLGIRRKDLAEVK